MVEETQGGAFEKQVAVVDSMEGPEYDAIGPIVFSGNSKRYAYTAKRLESGKRAVVVIIDGPRGEWLRRRGEKVTFSPNGKHVAFQAGKGTKSGLVVVDGQIIATTAA